MKQKIRPSLYLKRNMIPVIEMANGGYFDIFQLKPQQRITLKEMGYIYFQRNSKGILTQEITLKGWEWLVDNV